MADPYLGEIRMFAGNFAPLGWAFCNGQLLPIAQYDALYAILGTTYGGDGQTTFALPDLRGRGPIHAGQGPGLSNHPQGEQGGTETVTLTVAQMPGHTHVPAASSAAGTSSHPTGAVWAASSTSDNQYASSTKTPMNPGTVSAAGGNQPHDNLQPLLAINFIIALEGIFPSPN
ncbi:MAG TPA: tail fiber protein [Chloroflexia bacterium]